MYEVHWEESALNELAELWLAAESAKRGIITAATAELDNLLVENPGEQGESRCAGRRILFVGPLGVLFEVNNSKMVSRVIHVWTFRYRP